MINIRTRKVLRDLWSNKARTLLVTLAIAIGVFALSTVSRTRAILERDLTHSYLAVNPTCATLFAHPLNDDLIKSVRNIEGVQDTEGCRTIWARILVGQQQWRTLKLIAVSDFEEIKINKVSPEAGTWPPPDKALVLERSSLESINASVGDTILVEAFNGQQRLLPIAGLAHDLTVFPGDIADLVLFGYITLDTIEWFDVPPSYNELNITVAEDPLSVSHIQAVAARVENHLAGQGVKVLGTRIPNPGQHQLDTVSNSILLILNVLGMLALFLSALLVINTISALLARQIQQVGIMKAIGAPQGDIMLMYIGVVLMFSLLALLVSIPLGIVSARALSLQLARLLNFDINSFRVPLQVTLVEFGAGLAVPFIAAIYPIISGTRITVREAISTSGSNASQFGTGRLDKLLGRLRGTSAATLYAMRNIFRRKARLALTLTALSLGGAIFITVLSVDASLTLTVDRDTSAYWQQDLTINFQRPYRTQRIIREVLNVPGLVDIEGWETKIGYRIHPNGRKSKEDISIFGVPADTRFIEPNVLEGRWLNVEDTNALVINVYMLDKEPDIHIGDEIELEIEGHTDTWHIVGLVTTQMVGFEEPRLELPIAYANYAYLAKALGEVGQADRVVIKTEQDFESFHNQVAQALEEHLASKGIHIRSLETNSMLRSLAEDIIGILTNLLAFMAILFALVGGLSLMSTMSLNVLERTREIGVLRAIGASNGIVSQIIIYEGVFVGVLSWLLASILAIPLSKILSHTVGITLLNTPLHYSFPIRNLFVWFVIAVIISTLASYLPARNASKLSVREVLSYE